MRWSRWRTPAPACPPPSGNGSSGGSFASTSRPAGRCAAAWGWGSTWPASSPVRRWAPAAGRASSSASPWPAREARAPARSRPPGRARSPRDLPERSPSARSSRRAVQALDLAAVLLVDHAALELQRRCQLVGLHGPLRRQDREALDLLGAGEVLVDAGHGAIDLAVDALVVGELLQALVRDAVLGGPAGSCLRIEHDQRCRIGLAVAHHADLGDQRMRLEQVLEVGGGDVLAASGDEQLLLTVDDPHPAVAVDPRDVAGAQP